MVADAGRRRSGGVRSMEIGEAIAARLRARLNVIDLNDEELESWRLGKALAATVKPRPKT